MMHATQLVTRLSITIKLALVKPVENDNMIHNQVKSYSSVTYGESER